VTDTDARPNGGLAPEAVLEVRSALTVCPNSAHDCRNNGRTIHAQLHRCRSVRFAKALRGAGGERRHVDRADLSRPRQERIDPKGLPEWENGTGGVYLWDSRESAEAWFTEARIADLTERFGVRPRLTWYDTHVTVDNLKGETRVNGKAIEVVA
jgi:hypothetical protein